MNTRFKLVAMRRRDLMDATRPYLKGVNNQVVNKKRKPKRSTYRCEVEGLPKCSLMPTWKTESY